MMITNAFEWPGLRSRPAAEGGSRRNETSENKPHSIHGGLFSLVSFPRKANRMHKPPCLCVSVVRT